MMGGWLLLLAGQGVADEALPLPLELQWGGNPTRLMALADRFGMDKTVKTPGKDPRRMIVEVGPEKGSLPGHEATSLEARFIGGKLYQLTVHYTYPGRKTDFVRARFLELKKGLSLRHGKFRFDSEDKSAADGITTLSESYHIAMAEGRMLMLALTEYRDEKRADSNARFSVIYHNETVLNEAVPKGR